MKWEESFADRFSSLIEGRTYQEVSDLLEMSKATVSYYATGQRKPKTPALKHIAEKFGVDPVWLMGADVPKYKKIPAGVGEDLSEDKRYLIEKIMSLSDDEVRGLRTIVDQVLALRG